MKDWANTNEFFFQRRVSINLLTIAKVTHRDGTCVPSCFRDTCRCIVVCRWPILISLSCIHFEKTKQLFKHELFGGKTFLYVFTRFVQFFFLLNFYRWISFDASCPHASLFCLLHVASSGADDESAIVSLLLSALSTARRCMLILSCCCQSLCSHWSNYLLLLTVVVASVEHSERRHLKSVRPSTA